MKSSRRSKKNSNFCIILSVAIKLLYLNFIDGKLNFFMQNFLTGFRIKYPECHTFLSLLGDMSGSTMCIR
jgi:hypothetical protein